MLSDYLHVIGNKLGHTFNFHPGGERFQDQTVDDIPFPDNVPPGFQIGDECVSVGGVSVGRSGALPFDRVISLIQVSDCVYMLLPVTYV